MGKIQYQVRAAARSRGRPKIGPEDVGRTARKRLKAGRGVRVIPGPSTSRAAALYAEGYSLREVGKAMKIGEHAVRLRLAVSGTAARPKARQSSKLKRLDQAQLWGAIAAFGVQGAADRYRVCKRTLQNYLAKQGKR